MPVRQKAKIGKPKLRVVGGEATPEAPSTPQEVEYFKQLHKIIDEIFECAADQFKWTWSQLAVHADLGYGTVSNLGERITKYPRFSTVYKLAHAVGWELVTHETKKKAGPAKMKVAAV